eukprot:1140081-Prymnesium_polylepis.1
MTTHSTSPETHIRNPIRGRWSVEWHSVPASPHAARVSLLSSSPRSASGTARIATPDTHIHTFRHSAFTGTHIHNRI